MEKKEEMVDWVKCKTLDNCPKDMKDLYYSTSLNNHIDPVHEVNQESESHPKP